MGLCLFLHKSILEKSLVTTKFLKNKQCYYDKLKNEIEMLKQEVKESNFKQKITVYLKNLNYWHDLSVFSKTSKLLLQRIYKKNFSNNHNVGSGYVIIFISILLAQNNDVIVFHIDPMRIDRINKKKSTKNLQILILNYSWMEEKIYHQQRL